MVAGQGLAAEEQRVDMEQITERFWSWASILEDNTRAQVQMTSEMPFIFPHVALMPDAHLGKGCAVGAVLPPLGAIMPAAVGGDIGCGMGKFTIEFALANPEFNVLGLELRKRAVEWINTVIDSEKIPNVRALWYSVVNGLDFIESSSIEKIFYL